MPDIGRSKFIRYVQQNFMGKNKDEIVKFLKYVQQGMIFTVTMPRITGWTKNSAFNAISHPIHANLKFPVTTKLIRAEGMLGTAVGGGGMLITRVGTGAGWIGNAVTIIDPNVTGTLSFMDYSHYSPKVPANTAIACSIYETSGGSGDNLDCVYTFQAEPEALPSVQTTPLIEETMRLIPADLRDEWVYVMQLLQHGLISVVGRPTYASWTKNGSNQAIGNMSNGLEFPIKQELVYIAGYLGTAPGAGKTLEVRSASGVTLLTFSDTTQFAENAAPGLMFTKNTNQTLYLNETTGGSGANIDIVTVHRNLPLA